MQQLARFYVLAVVFSAGLGMLALGLAYFVPASVFRSYGLVLERLDTIAIGSSALSAVTGFILLVGCFWAGIEPPRRLSNGLCAVVIIATALVVLLPAIQKS